MKSDLNVPVLIDGNSCPGYVLVGIADLDKFHIEGDVAADARLLDLFERVALRYPDATIALMDWVPNAERWPRTWQYLGNRGFGIPEPEAVPPGWKQAMLRQCGQPLPGPAGDPSQPGDWRPPRLPGSETHHFGPLEVSPDDDGPCVFTAISDDVVADDQALVTAIETVTRAWPEKQLVTVGWHPDPARWPRTAALMQSVGFESEHGLPVRPPGDEPGGQRS